MYGFENVYLCCEFLCLAVGSEKELSNLRGLESHTRVNPFSRLIYEPDTTMNFKES